MPEKQWDVDVTSSDLGSDDSYWHIRECLQSKGFCVIETKLKPFELDESTRELDSLMRDDRFERLPEEVLRGYMGPRGSEQIAEVDDLIKGDASRKVVQLMGDVCGQVQAMQYYGGINLKFPDTSKVTAHISDDYTGFPAELTEDMAESYSSIFSRTRLMTIVFLGPGSGILELKLAGDDEAGTFEIPTAPGIMVMLRSDVLYREHIPAMKSFALSFFSLDEANCHWTKREAGKKFPGAVDLQSYLDEIKMDRKAEKIEDTMTLGGEIPREIQFHMNREQLRGNRVAVNSSCKFGDSHGVDEFQLALVAGVDYVIEVPLSRWDYTHYYDPSPFSSDDKINLTVGVASLKNYCKHMSFVPNADLFDNKFFMIAPAEAEGQMDPNQFQLLEVGYEAAHVAGKTKKTLIETDTGAICGGSISEAAAKQMNYMGVYGSDLALLANRISFVFGMKGPSLSVDCDVCSGLVATNYGLCELGKGNMCCLCYGHYFALLPLNWPVWCAGRLMSPIGRAQSFDANASGWVRGDGVACLHIQQTFEILDGKEVLKNGVPYECLIQGTGVKYQGKCASMQAIHAPAMQEMVEDTVRKARISVLDVDLVECNAVASILNDAIEVGATVRCMRPNHEYQSQLEPLGLNGASGAIGNVFYTSGMASLFKAFGALRYGVTTPLCHFSRVNPHIQFEAEDGAVRFLTEHLELRGKSNFAMCQSFATGGLQACVVLWAETKRDMEKGTLKSFRPKEIQFWPGGGGELKADLTPKRAYTISGSWTGWTLVQDLEDEGGGVYGMTLVLPNNSIEDFQIYLDGDPQKVLHPEVDRAGSGSQAIGPHGAQSWQCWRIVTAASENMSDVRAFEVEYRLRFRVAGKWRSVEWQRMTGVETVALGYEPSGAWFYVVPDWNNFMPIEMKCDDDAPDVFYLEITMEQSGGNFYIVRNLDPASCFHPKSFFATDADSNPVIGPDQGGAQLVWSLQAKAGDIYRIEFQIASDSGTASMSWRRLSEMSAITG